MHFSHTCTKTVFQSVRRCECFYRKFIFRVSLLSTIVRFTRKTKGRKKFLCRAIIVADTATNHFQQPKHNSTVYGLDRVYVYVDECLRSANNASTGHFPQSLCKFHEFLLLRHSLACQFLMGLSVGCLIFSAGYCCDGVVLMYCVSQTDPPTINLKCELSAPVQGQSFRAITNMTISLGSNFRRISLSTDSDFGHFLTHPFHLCLLQVSSPMWNSTRFPAAFLYADFLLFHPGRPAVRVGARLWTAPRNMRLMMRSMDRWFFLSRWIFLRKKIPQGHQRTLPLTSESPLLDEKNGSGIFIFHPPINLFLLHPPINLFLLHPPINLFLPLSSGCPVHRDSR